MLELAHDFSFTNPVGANDILRGWTRELKSMRVGYPRIPAFAVPNTCVFRSSAPLWDFMYSEQI